METMYVTETLRAQREARLNEQLRIARLAKREAARPTERRAFAFTLWRLEVTVRTVGKPANQ